MTAIGVGGKGVLVWRTTGVCVVYSLTLKKGVLVLAWKGDGKGRICGEGLQSRMKV